MGARNRIRIVLDDETLRAAQELALHNGCSVADAIRRAVIDQRNVTPAPSTDTIRDRVKTLERLFELFAHNDAAKEIAQLKADDEGF